MYSRRRKIKLPSSLAGAKNDHIIIPLGAEAFKRDFPNAAVSLLD